MFLRGATILRPKAR